MQPDVADEEEWGRGPDEEWRGPPTVFIVIEVRAAAGERLAAIQRRFDPKLAARTPPHLTLTGSSGVGPIPGSVPIDELRAALTPIAASTPPFTVPFGRPERFMQTNIVVLPLDPHGPIRDLHERVARSGLPFAPAKFTFTPHVTLNYFATLTNEQVGRVLRERVDEPLIVDHLQCSLARDPDKPAVICELPLLSA
ncbi:MAG: 2'-5' RNA ligase family protein [Gemmatimonadaceae bacterium]